MQILELWKQVTITRPYREMYYEKFGAGYDAQD
jgi:hypothetical protein